MYIYTILYVIYIANKLISFYWIPSTHHIHVHVQQQTCSLDYYPTIYLNVHGWYGAKVNCTPNLHGQASFENRVDLLSDVVRLQKVGVYLRTVETLRGLVTIAVWLAVMNKCCLWCWWWSLNIIVKIQLDTIYYKLYIILCILCIYIYYYI